MKYYNLLYFGLMRLAEKTTYKEISEYVAAWGMALIIELNLIAVVGILGQGALLKAYFLVPLYILFIYMSVLYYKKKITVFNKLKKEYGEINSGDANINFPEGFALFFIFECVLVPFLF